MDVQDQLQPTESKERFIAQNAGHYDNAPKYQLPEPKTLMTAKSYREKVADTLVQKLKVAIRSILLQFFEKTRELKTVFDRAQVWNLSNQLDKYQKDNKRLKDMEKDYRRLRYGIGDDKAEEIIREVKAQEIVEKKRKTKSWVFRTVRNLRTKRMGRSTSLFALSANY